LENLQLARVELWDDGDVAVGVNWRGKLPLHLLLCNRFLLLFAVFPARRWLLALGRGLLALERGLLLLVAFRRRIGRLFRLRLFVILARLRGWRRLLWRRLLPGLWVLSLG
jgi:hypothetical protein